MLNSKGHHAAITRKLILPDIEPEDLGVPHTLGLRRTRPMRKSELREETVEVE